jgi:hypothetical protein
MGPNEKSASPKLPLPALIAEHTLVVWCDECRQDRMLVISGQNFQAAWCLNCRGVLSLVVPSPERGGIYVIRTKVRCWMNLGDRFLIHTTRGLIPIRIGFAGNQRERADLVTGN